ncbi:MAG TPA: hypothetical protein PLU30_26970 [Verrucomicrobiae bacterium]|nr:hypothetical protein [Verrucomicrobiae bacterium]
MKRGMVAGPGAVVLAALLQGLAVAGPMAGAPGQLERSYWVHASLGPTTQRGYFGLDFPGAEPPTREAVANAARLLGGPYGANRLYLIYHREMPIGEARRVFAWWREACAESVELIPALVLRMYDKSGRPVFSDDEMRGLCDFFRENINRHRVAVYDVYAKRDQGAALAVLAKRFPGGVIRVGLQPTEEVDAPFVAAVQDTWSGFCHGTRNHEHWLQPGFGAETLRRWVTARNGGAKRIAWNLIVVAWDYAATERGGYPGYDDAAKNMPLPAGRNRIGAGLIARAAARGQLAGFSSDLHILDENSRSVAHDGKAGAFYQTLREGKEYTGYYAVPFREITQIFGELREGRWPAE